VQRSGDGGTRPGRSFISFFPSNSAELDALATEMGLPKQLVRDRVGELGGGNSKLGLRGARWAVKDPELFASFARAVFEAAADKLEAGPPPGALRPHIPNGALGSDPGRVFLYERLERLTGPEVLERISGAAAALSLREAFDELVPPDIGAWAERAVAPSRDQRADGVPMPDRRPQLLDALNRLYAGRRPQDWS